MDEQIWSWILGAIGICGFILAGRKVWWAWYINIANQFVWLAYAVVTQQWDFLVLSVFYFIVFTKNAVSWTREHHREKTKIEIRDAVFDDAVRNKNLEALADEMYNSENSIVRVAKGLTLTVIPPKRTRARPFRFRKQIGTFWGHQPHRSHRGWYSSSSDIVVTCNGEYTFLTLDEAELLKVYYPTHGAEQITEAQAALLHTYRANKQSKEIEETLKKWRESYGPIRLRGELRRIRYAKNRPTADELLAQQKSINDYRRDLGFVAHVGAS